MGIMKMYTLSEMNQHKTLQKIDKIYKKMWLIIDIQTNFIFHDFC